jgi:hypothetical protein
MKNYLLVVLSLVIMFSIASCKKIDRLTNFYFDSSINISVDSAQYKSSTVDIWILVVNADYTSLYIENNSRIDLSETIVLDNLIFRVNSPQNQTLNFLQSAEIYIRTNELEEIKIAWIDNIPDDGLTEVEMETSEDNIQDYILNDQYILRFITKGINPGDSIVSIDFQYSYLATTNLSEI